MFFGFVLSNAANAVVVQPSGKIVVGGQYDRNFALARVLDNGVIDTSFGNAGYAFDDLGGTDVINALALAADGRINAAGHRIQNNDADMALAQDTPDGRLEPCADPAACDRWLTGTFFVDAGTNDYAYALNVRADHQLVAAGYSNQHMAGMQVRTDGEPVPLPLNTDFAGYPDCARGVKFIGENHVRMAGDQNHFPFNSDSNVALAQFETTPYTPPAPDLTQRLFLPFVNR